VGLPALGNKNHVYKSFCKLPTLYSGAGLFVSVAIQTFVTMTLLNFTSLSCVYTGDRLKLG